MTRDIKLLNEKANVWGKKIQSVFIYKNIQGGIVGSNAGARQLTFPVELFNPLQLDEILGFSENIALFCRVKNVLAYRSNGQVLFQIELPSHLWKSYKWGVDCKGLQLGLTDTKEPVEFSFDPPHHLFCGTTTAGKSYAVRIVLLGLIEEFTPDDLGIVIVDPHGDFEVFDNEIHLLRRISTTTEEAINSIYYVYDILKHRVENNIRDDKKIVLIVDESQTLVDKSGDIKFWLKEIGNQAAKFGVHLILTSKKPTQFNLPDIVNVLGNRWIGRTELDPATTARIIGQKGVLVSKLTSKGDFLHVAQGGIERFLVASVDDNVFNQLDRCDIQNDDINFSETNTMPSTIESRGRPKICVDPESLARYYLLGPEGITIAEAESILGLKRTGHDLHRDFVKRFGIAFKQLRSIYKGQSIEQLEQDYATQYK